MSDDQASIEREREEHEKRSAAHVDAVRHFISMFLAGVSTSGRFGRERHVLGGSLIALHQACSIWLQMEYKRGGRPAFEKARRIVLDLSGMFSDEVLKSVNRIEEAITAEEMTDLETMKTPKREM